MKFCDSCWLLPSLNILMIAAIDEGGQLMHCNLKITLTL